SPARSEACMILSCGREHFTHNQMGWWGRRGVAPLTDYHAARRAAYRAIAIALAVCAGACGGGSGPAASSAPPVAVTPNPAPAAPPAPPSGPASTPSADVKPMLEIERDPDGSTFVRVTEQPYSP